MKPAKINVPNHSVFNRDNIDILRGINSNSVDLIYLDPPFNTKKSFTAPIGSSAEGASFKDIFYAEDIKDEWLDTIKQENTPLHNFLLHTKTDGIRHNYCYLCYMAIRLLECHRVLKPTGSLYLHVDPTMSHYLKVVMDNIFGAKHFKNEIVWFYGGPSRVRTIFPQKHDVIFCYSKTDSRTFNPQRGEIPQYLYDRARQDEDGRLWVDQNLGNLTDDTIAQMKKEGRVFTTTSGRLRRKQYLDEMDGAQINDVWNIPVINSQSKERTGYPTQKPLVLLERIIKASSNEGDVVLDPFCGCATACVAAERLSRKWIGIDISVKAYELIKQRLRNEIATLEEIMWDEKINFSTYPPTRTDQGLPENIEQGYVYVISHPILTPHYAEGKMTYKVGIAKNFERRLASYQTSAPGRAYAEEYKVLTPKYKEIEQAIFKKFQGDRENEWVTASKMDIIAAIQEML